MGGKNISIKDEAYDILKSLKLQGESFSETIIRLSKHFGNIQESFGQGVLSNEEYENEIRNIRNMREKMIDGREIS